MENYQMNRPGCRPYNRTCGMINTPASAHREQMNRRPGPDCCGKKECSCHMPGPTSENREMFEHLQHFPLAMAYVPCQEFVTTFDLCHALSVGTIFPELCKPFCGRRGGSR